jgi:pimeloyl-ACP methyl ester carboxylesterase
MKKLKKWGKRILLALLGLLITAVLTGVVYEQISRSNFNKKFTPPGQMVDVGGHQLHFISKGTGSPTVVFEAGLDAAGSLAWRAVQDSVAQFTKTIAYDRAGVLWSQRGKGPKTGSQIAEELHALLQNAGHEGPYILVGHSLAGITLRPFLDKYRAEVAGLVLVDASHPEQLDRFPEQAKKMMQQPPSWLLKVIAEIGLVRLVTQNQQLPGSNIQDGAEQVINGRMPLSMKGVADEIGNLPALAKESQQAGKLDSLPLIVLTANTPDRYKEFPDTTIGKEVAKIWMELQKDHLNLSTQSEHILANESGHYVQFDQPELVIEAIKSLVEKAEGF